MAVHQLDRTDHVHQALDGSRNHNHPSDRPPAPRREPARRKQQDEKGKNRPRDHLAEPWFEPRDEGGSGQRPRRNDKRPQRVFTAKALNLKPQAQPQEHPTNRVIRPSQRDQQAEGRNDQREAETQTDENRVSEADAWVIEDVQNDKTESERDHEADQ